MTTASVLATPFVLAVAARRLDRASAVLALLLLGTAFAVPVPTSGEATARVGMVQGNVPRAGRSPGP